MKKKIYGTGLSLAVVAVSMMPALANITDITINANLEDIMSLQIEKASGSGTDQGVVVSVDNVDPNGQYPGNEVLNFGDVNPKGLETGTGIAVDRPGFSADNGTIFQVKSMVIDSANKLHDPVENGTNLLPKAAGANIGALYYTNNAVQLRSLRTGGGNMKVDVFNEGDFDAVVAKSNTVFTHMVTDFTPIMADKGHNSSAPDVDSAATGLDMVNDTPEPLALGIIVPYTMQLSTGTTKTTLITFKGQ